MRDLTSGSLTRHLLGTAGFMLVTMVFQTLYFLVDLYWVGRLGKEAVAAVGVAGNLMFVSLAVSQMLGVGTTVLVSHATGAKDLDRARLVFAQSQMLAMLVAAVFLAAGLAVHGSYARALSADASTAAMAAGYMRIFLPAMALQFGIVVMGAALRGTGNFRPSMVVQSVTVLLNMALAPVLIFGWGTGRPMGVSGAALATLVAVAVGTAWLAGYFFRPGATLTFAHLDWKPRTDLWAALLRVGLPAGAEFALMAAYLFLVYAVSRPFGAAAQAGFGIGMRVVQAGFMPVVALGFSVGPVAGQNFGARRMDRVRGTFRLAALLAASVMALLTLAAHLFPAAMIRVFSADPAVIAAGEEYLRIVSWSFVASGVVFVASSMFQAVGNSVPALISSFARIVLVATPVLLLSRVPGFSLRWVWWLSVASIAIQMTLSLLLLRREMRVRAAALAAAAA